MSNEKELAALVDAISWSNANLYFDDSDYRTDNSTDQKVAADILRGLEHVGWKLVKVSMPYR